MFRRRTSKREYSQDDWDLYVWPDPLSGDPEDYGPTDMQSRLFLYHREPWQREHFHNLDIVLMVGGAGSGKSWRRGTGVLLETGHIKKVEDIIVGDRLLGPDSTVRRVTALGRGIETFYKVTPTKGEPFFCNESHILTLKSSDKTYVETRIRADGSIYIKPPRYGGQEIINVPVKEYLTWSKRKKNVYKLYRADNITFPSGPTLPLDPYILGVWLGDGTSNTPSITTMDLEILEAFQNFADNHEGHSIREGKKTKDNKASTYHITTGNVGGIQDSNAFLTLLRNLNVLNNKHIPHEYKVSSRENRLSLLAGLIDTDGYLGSNVMEITQKNKQLAQDIAFLCRSLGLAAYIREVQKSCMVNGEKFTGTYHKISISGDLSVIPCRLKRKQATPRLQVKDHLVTGFTLEKLPEEEYFGFTLDGDHLFLLEDFTVAHNSICGIAEIIELSATFPNCLAIVGGVDMPLLKRNVTDKFGDRLSYRDRSSGATLRWEHPLVLHAPAEKTPVAQLKNGSTIRFLNIDDPDKVRGFTGDIFMIEEANLMEADSLREMFRRSRGTALPTRQIILNMNPTGRRDWVYDMFNLKQFEPGYDGPPLPIGDPCTCHLCHICQAAQLGDFEWEGGDKRVKDGKFYEWIGGECPNPECPTYLQNLKKGRDKKQKKINSCPGHQHYYRVILSKSYDNPHIPQDYVQLQRGALSDEEYAMYVEGAIVNCRQGFIYKEFSPANVREASFDPSKDIHWTMDFNYEPMASLICQEVPDGIQVVDEFTLWDYDELMVAKHFAQKYAGFKKKVHLYGDPNGIAVRSRADSKKSSFKVIINYLTSAGFDVELKMDTTKGSILIPIVERINNLKAALRDHTGISKVFISSNCKNLLESIQNTQWDEKTSRPKEDENCDALAKTNPKRFTSTVLMTHHQAALGYMICRLLPLLSGKKGVRLLIDQDKVVKVEPQDKELRILQRPETTKTEEKEDLFKQKAISEMLPALSHRQTKEIRKLLSEDAQAFQDLQEEAARQFFG